MATPGDEEQYSRALDLIKQASEVIAEIQSQEEIRNSKLVAMLTNSLRYTFQDLAAVIRGLSPKLKGDHTDINWGAFEMTSTMNLWKSPKLNAALLIETFDPTLIAVQKLLLSELLSSSLGDIFN